MLFIFKCVNVRMKTASNALALTCFIRSYSNKLSVKQVLRIVPDQSTSVTVQVRPAAAVTNYRSGFNN